MRPWQSDTDKYRQEFLSRVWPAMNGIHWDKPDYSVEKAYVCAMFSKLAYLKIPGTGDRGRSLGQTRTVSDLSANVRATGIV